MKITSRIEPIDKVLTMFLQEGLSGREKSNQFGAWAGVQIEDAKQSNARVIGRVPPYTVSVDGRMGAPLNSVRPDNGIIIAEFERLNTETLRWIGEQLVLHSPVLTGRYQDSHVLIADTVTVGPGQPIPLATEYIFLNVQPYARKIERGLSSQAPDGVYQGVASLASKKFGNASKISFSYRSAAGFESLNKWASSTGLGSHIRNKTRRADWLRRQPAVIVRPI